MHTDLRFGRWQDVLVDETCDALIFDAPHSKAEGDVSRSDGYASAGLLPSSYESACAERSLERVERHRSEHARPPFPALHAPLTHAHEVWR